MAPTGRSGGMLVGIHRLVFDIGEVEEGNSFIRFKLGTRNMILSLI